MNTGIQDGYNLAWKIAQTGFAHVGGLCGMLFALPVVGRGEEARAIAEETLTAARAHGNPSWVAEALLGNGLAFAKTDPARALTVFREALVYTREHRLMDLEAIIAQNAAGLEAVHGELDQALVLFDTANDSFHQAGDVAGAGATFAYLAVFFDRVERPEIAATLYGTTARHPSLVNRPGVVDHLRSVLGETVFDECVAVGAARALAEAVRYARHQIHLARREVGNPTGAAGRGRRGR